MSFTVFSARSIANDLENAVGEEAFYFYMREIIDGKLCESYKDAVNGEECKFDGLLQFMQHKNGLGIKDLALFEKCLSAVASSSHKMACNAEWLMIEMKGRKPLPQNGENQFTTQGYDNVIPSQLGNSRDYLLRRIARDRPELLSDIGKDKRLKSARAAAIEAGIITPSPSLQLKDPAPTAQKLLAKKGQAWCLQLLEELSELVL
ncbi:hypothetical protein UFOVP383_63 [uncultured Caudovirales phage]|uniref:Uncharacterized protein n=1 Tax=uncultured Caudovirales phage TaxID=2100421 RepID=A0A6J7X2W6_9CAUD|nr:hypothetical protein UFOVP383_63 [uncultured Caudovirales phage]